MTEYYPIFYIYKTGVQTKVEIEDIDYDDIISMEVEKNIGDFNSSSSFSISFNNYGGRYSDTFSIGDEVIIYADRNIYPSYTVLLKGTIEDIDFSGQENKEQLVISGRDYSSLLQDIIVEPRVFKSTEVSAIVTAIVQQNISSELLTINNVNTTTTTIEKISFQNVSVFDALKKLGEASGYYFYVDSDIDLHFEQKDTTSSGLTFNNTNIKKAKFKTSDSEIFNRITFYGDRILAGQEDIFTSTGGSSYTLTYKPHNLTVYLSGTNNTIYQPAGVLNIGNPAEEDIKYLVDFQGQKFVMTSGTIAGDNIAPTGSVLIARYEKSVPIIKIKADFDSQASYGLKKKVIIDKSVKSPEEANNRAQTYLDEHKDPKIQGNIVVRGVLDVTPGQTCVVNIPFQGISSQTYTIISAKYSFNKYNTLNDEVLTLTLNKRIKTLTDTLKEQITRLKSIEIGDLDVGIVQTDLTLGSVGVSGTYTAIKRSIGSAFYFHVPNHNILNSTSSLLGDMRAGSTVTTG